jgi:hypothetical protein
MPRASAHPARPLLYRVIPAQAGISRPRGNDADRPRPHGGGPRRHGTFPTLADALLKTTINQTALRLVPKANARVLGAPACWEAGLRGKSKGSFMATVSSPSPQGRAGDAPPPPQRGKPGGGAGPHSSHSRAHQPTKPSRPHRLGTTGQAPETSQTPSPRSSHPSPHRPMPLASPTN